MGKPKHHKKDIFFDKKRKAFDEEEEDLSSSFMKKKKSVAFSESATVSTFTTDYDDNDDEDLEKARKRRGAVNLDGYDSDDDVIENKIENEDDDMFANSSESKRENEDLIGQEWTNTEDVLTEGIAIEPFNMDQELEEGTFDENGHYVRKADENVFHDRWLQDVSESDIRKAKRAQERQIARSQVAEESNMPKDESSLLLIVVRHMHPQEDIFAALRRLAPQKKSKAKSWQKNKKAAAAESHQDMDTDEIARKKTIDEITSAADELMSLGNSEAYEQTYEQIIRKLRIAEVLDDSWMPGDPIPEVNVQNKTVIPEERWEYKWSLESEEVYGPYTTDSMKEWISQNFFPETVVVRKVKSNTSLDNVKDFVPLSQLL